MAVRTLCLVLLLAGCAHPQAVRVDPSQSAWFVTGDEVWYCAPAQKPLCRRFGVAVPGECHTRATLDTMAQDLREMAARWRRETEGGLS